MEKFRALLSNLSSDDIVVFRNYRLAPAQLLAHFVIDWDFLKAAATFWDPHNHVFRFGDREICPLPEEFSALLSIPHMGPPALLGEKQDYAKTFKKILGLTDKDAEKIIVGDEANLVELVKRFARPIDQSEKRTTRMKALCFCMLAYYFFVHGNSEMADLRLITFLEPLNSGSSILPLVVGETIIGLDAVHEHPGSRFRGSPFLLQMWLMERLSLIQPVPRHYHAVDFLRRVRLYKRMDINSWMDKLFTIEDIRWTVPWWKIKIMKGCANSTSHIRIYGLDASTLIFPRRIKRQYGLRQMVPSLDAIVNSRFSLTPYTWSGYWNTLPNWMSSGNEDNLDHVSSFYLEWMHNSTSVVRSRAREQELEEQRVFKRAAEDGSLAAYLAPKKNILRRAMEESKAAEFNKQPARAHDHEASSSRVANDFEMSSSRVRNLSRVSLLDRLEKVDATPRKRKANDVKPPVPKKPVKISRCGNRIWRRDDNEEPPSKGRGKPSGSKPKVQK